MTQPINTGAQNYAVYYLSASNGHPAGYVWLNVMWDGVSDWKPFDGSAAVADPDRNYPIGSIYPVT